VSRLCTCYCTYKGWGPWRVEHLSTLFADRIRTAKQLNRTSGKILAEARERPVTVVSAGAEPVVIQSRARAARQAHAEVVLGTVAALSAFLLEVEPGLPPGLRWVKELHPTNVAQFRRELPREALKAKGSGNFDAFEDWLNDWKIAAELDADPVLRRRLGLRA
jgi:hypothetical protein